MDSPVPTASTPAPGPPGPLPPARAVEALRDPRCYPDPVAEVRALETHMSWVFLAGAHAWKLKKPVRFDRLDFRTAAARHYYCLEELRLNRRLAPTVYLDVVPLTQEADGSLRAGGGGPVVDWLVKMRRLAPQRMLDALLAARAAAPADLRAVAIRLAEFHRTQPRAPIGERGYRALLLRHLEESEHELCNPDWRLPRERIHALCEAQRAWVHAHASLLGARVAAGRVIEGHGDLRPEHVWLGEPLSVIDALEFSPELRTMDAADDIGLLALECERAHAEPLAQALLQAWREASGDAAPQELLHFYQSLRACTRARLAIAHLREERYRASGKWRLRTLRYLALARRHLREARRDPVACYSTGSAGVQPRGPHALEDGAQ